MNINELTYGQIQEIAKLACAPKGKRAKDFELGKSYLIRTVTFYWIGTVTKETARFVTLEPASCIYDTGRFATALAEGKLNEVEPCNGHAMVAIGAIVDVEPWSHEVPKVQK